MENHCRTCSIYGIKKIITIPAHAILQPTSPTREEATAIYAGKMEQFYKTVEAQFNEVPREVRSLYQGSVPYSYKGQAGEYLTIIYSPKWR